MYGATAWEVKEDDWDPIVASMWINCEVAMRLPKLSLERKSLLFKSMVRLKEGIVKVLQTIDAPNEMWQMRSKAGGSTYQTWKGALPSAEELNAIVQKVQRVIDKTPMGSR